MFFGKKAKLDLVTLDGTFDFGPMKILSQMSHWCDTAARYKVVSAEP